MLVYIVICNGKVSSEGFTTLADAQAFCMTRGASPVYGGNGWKYSDDKNEYEITDIAIRKKD